MPHVHTFSTHVYLNNLRTNTCVLVLVGVVHAFWYMLLDRSSMCKISVSQEIEESRKMAKRLLKELEDLQVWSFLKTAICFLSFARHCSSFLYSSTLPWTSRDGGYVWFSVYTSVLHQSPSSFFLTLVTIF